MIASPQRVMASIGKAGCYVLCILRHAEKLRDCDFSPLAEYGSARMLGFLREDCYVWSAGKLLGHLAGGSWIVLKAGDGLDSAGKLYDLPLAYVPAEGELEIDRYGIDGEEEGHFVVGDGVTVDWDPYGDSRTVRLGHLVSKRIFRRTA